MFTNGWSDSNEQGTLYTATWQVIATIEYFYSAHSAFAYLGSARFMQIARAAGRRIVHRPIDLHRVMVEGGAQPFGQRGKAHTAYYFSREIERWSEYRDVPTLGRIPTHHANDYTLANCLLIAAINRGIDIDSFAHAMLTAHWRNDADLADRSTLVAIGQSLDFDTEPLLSAALSPEIQHIYLTNTEEAIQRSIFGSPTYIVDGDIFYGQDRLEMIERALEHPFANTWGAGQTS
jgi:2-hydroxychromene-2-carboxylate isomerase